MNKKRLLANGLLVLFSTALSLLVLEQSYRVYIFGSAGFSINKMNSLQNLGVSGLLKPSNHSEIIYELKPNLNTYFKLAKFKTNSKGLRDKDYNFSKSGDIFRVAVIGDSVTMPSGVEIEESYHSLLEEKLNNEQKKLTYQFINFGVGGYSLRQYLGVIRFKAQEYDPDLIMVGFCPQNDHFIPPNKRFEQQYKIKPATYPFFQFHIIKRAKQRIFKNKNKRGKRKINNAVPFSEEQKKYMSHIFSEMKAYSMEKNIPIIIIYLDNKYNERYASELRELVVDNGLYFVNVSLPFKGTNVNEYMIYQKRKEGHPNGRANRIFAETLYDYLNLNSGNKKNFLYEKKND